MISFRLILLEIFELPINILKLDMSFINESATTRKKDIESNTYLAENEPPGCRGRCGNEKQVLLLRKLGCDTHKFIITHRPKSKEDYKAYAGRYRKKRYAKRYSIAASRREGYERAIQNNLIIDPILTRLTAFGRKMKVIKHIMSGKIHKGLDHAAALRCG